MLENVRVGVAWHDASSRRAPAKDARAEAAVRVNKTRYDAESIDPTIRERANLTRESLEMQTEETECVVNAIDGSWVKFNKP